MAFSSLEQPIILNCVNHPFRPSFGRDKDCRPICTWCIEQQKIDDRKAIHAEALELGKARIERNKAEPFIHDYYRLLRLQDQQKP